MSWDILVYAAKAPPPKVENLPEDWNGEPLGTTEEVRKKLSAAAPDIDWADPTWGDLQRGSLSIEFNVGSEEPCASLGLHVRGNDSDGQLSELLDKFVQQNGWYGLDSAQGEWFHFLGDPKKGFLDWVEFRDKISDTREMAVKKPFWRRWFE